MEIMSFHDSDSDDEDEISILTEDEKREAEAFIPRTDFSSSVLKMCYQCPDTERFMRSDVTAAENKLSTIYNPVSTIFNFFVCIFIMYCACAELMIIFHTLTI